MHQPGSDGDGGDYLHVVAGRRRLGTSAAASLQRTADLVAALGRVAGVKTAFTAPRFHEAVLLLDRPVAPVLARWRAAGSSAGWTSPTVIRNWARAPGMRH